MPGLEIGAPEAVGLEALVQTGHLRMVAAPATPVAKSLQGNPRLSAADRDCLSLAHERSARLLADDAAVVSAAKQLQIRLGGTPVILFSTVDLGDLKPRATRDYLDKLID